MGEGIIKGVLVGAVGFTFQYLFLALEIKHMAKLTKITTYLILIILIAPVFIEFIENVKDGIDTFLSRLEAIIDGLRRFGDLITFWN